jgi:hypothetical protein
MKKVKLQVQTKEELLEWLKDVDIPLFSSNAYKLPDNCRYDYIYLEEYKGRYFWALAILFKNLQTSAEKIKIAVSTSHKVFKTARGVKASLRYKLKNITRLFANK